jgi:glycosyltransferase involved in cell wall biosynthesis
MLEHPQLAQVLAAADVFCLPSYREGLPLVVCEAMLSGRPIVATPVGGIPEILTDGKHGYLVEAGNPHALSQRLRAIAGDPGRSNQMGLAAREFALHHLTWRANAQRYNDVYHRVANLSRLERANRTA